MKKLLIFLLVMLIIPFLVPNIVNAQFESPYVDIQGKSPVSHYDEDPLYDIISCWVRVYIPEINSWENYFVKIEVSANTGTSGYKIITFGYGDGLIDRSYPILLKPGTPGCPVSHSWKGYYIRVKLFYYSSATGVILINSTGTSFGHPLYRTDDIPRVDVPFMGIP
jgi:hypothetical protein